MSKLTSTAFLLHPAVRRYNATSLNPQLYCTNGLRRSIPPKTRTINMTDSSKAPTKTSDPKQTRFCTKCATLCEWQIPPGDERHRHVCPSCGFIAYENPRVVVGCVAVSLDNERVLLARRAIAPIGKWTLPAGFLELGETAHEGAAREAWEETYAKINFSPLSLLAVYNILPAKQVQLLFRGIVLNEDDVKPGIESLEVRLFPWDSLPGEDELAFPTISWALNFAKENRHQQIFQPDIKSR